MPLMRRLALPSLSCLMLTVLCACQPGSQHIEVNGIKRTYEVHVPASLEPGVPAPLVIALHQFSDTARGMRRLSQFDALADTEGFVAVYPDGLQRRWRVWERGGRIDDVDFLLALIEAVNGRHPVDRARIYVTGASNGGMMAQFFACATEVPAAIAPVMGSMTASAAEAYAPPAPVPVLLIHGVDDPVVPYEGTDTNPVPGQEGGFLSAEANAAFWAGRNGCTGEPTRTVLPNETPDDQSVATRITYEGCPETAPVMLYSIAGGGHTWPGHKNYYPRFIVGPTPYAIDATQVIWDFFKQHARPTE
jgi:polyhydroxybutyrate depolymerase